MQKSLIKSLKPYCAIAIEKQRRYPTLQSWCYVEVWLLFPHNLCSFGMKRTAVIPQYSVYTSLKILQFFQWISIERFMKEEKKPHKHWYCSLFVIIITDVFDEIVSLLSQMHCNIKSLFHIFVIWLKIYEIHWQNITALGQ